MTRIAAKQLDSLYRETELIKLNSPNGEIVNVKYIKPGLQQMPNLLKFVCIGVRDILYSQEQYSKMTYFQLTDECSKHFTSFKDKTDKDEYIEFLGKIFMNAEAVESLNSVIQYCFPELQINKLTELVYMQCATQVVSEIKV